MTARGYVLLPDRGVLALGGVDSRQLLQGLISSDVEKISTDQAGYGALLTPQGKFLFDFLIVQHGDALLLESERARLDQLRKRLMMYRLRSRVEITDVTADFVVAAWLGEDVANPLELPERPGAARALPGGVVFVDPRHAGLGVRALLPADRATGILAALGWPELSWATYERRRIGLGVPDGSRDLVVERSTLLESGFEELHGVDFDKGCFVGQELTARMRYRGLVRKRLVPVLLEGPPPAPGTIIRLGERDAGEMRSSIDGCGLALLRLEQIARAQAEATPLLAGATEVHPAPPDWLTL